MQAFGKASLGVSTFYASAHANDQCGADGLPLTPNSIKILGRFQTLKAISHPRLCQYVDVVRGKHERLILVTEHYSNNVQLEAAKGTFASPVSLTTLIYEVLEGLAYMGEYGLTHRALSPQNILLDPENGVKLAKFGLYHMTNSGADVTFPIGHPRYMAPETFAAGPVQPSDQTQIHSGPKADVWSLGIIILEVCLGTKLWSACTLQQLISKVLLFGKLKSQQHPLESILKEHSAENKFQELSASIRSFLRQCLELSPHDRWIEALQDERTMLTASAVRGVDAQSVPDCERMFSKGVIDFFEEKGYDREAKFAKLLHNWHKATDGRGLSEKERHDYNMAMLDYILDDWIPGHKDHKDFSQVDVNKPLKGIRGLTRETIIGLTTNISSQELRRLETPPEHPRASTSDCCESFIAILHHMLGRTFDFKAFNNAYRKIFTEHEKMMDSELPFYYYRSPRGRFTTDPLPDFNMPSSSGVERLDRVRGSRFGHPGTSLPSRSRMPRHGGRTIRDAQWRKEEPIPSLHLDT